MKSVEQQRTPVEMVCTLCGADILLGEPLYWEPVHGLSRWHEACAHELGLIEPPVPAPRQRRSRASSSADAIGGGAAAPRPHR